MSSITNSSTKRSHDHHSPTLNHGTNWSIQCRARRLASTRMMEPNTSGKNANANRKLTTVPETMPKRRAPVMSSVMARNVRKTPLAGISMTENAMKKTVQLALPAT